MFGSKLFNRDTRHSKASELVAIKQGVKHNNGTQGQSELSQSAEQKVMVELRGVSKSVTCSSSDELALQILQPVSLQVKVGESLALVGASGAGKTTLLGLMAGLDVPSTGQIFLNGHELNTLDEDGRADVRAESVGFIFQSFQLLPGSTALENVMLPLELKDHNMGYAQIRAFASDLLQQVGLGERLHHYPQQLSGGEQQRVAIARAFACQPKVLFADEPTGNLDLNTGRQIIELLFDLNKQYQTTLVFVTHEQRLADLCHRKIEISNQTIQEHNLKIDDEKENSVCNQKSDADVDVNDAGPDATAKGTSHACS